MIISHQRFTALFAEFQRMWTFNLLNTGSKTLKSSMLKGSQLFKNIRPVQVKFFSVPTNIDTATYLYLTNETLESLNDKFGELIEDHDKFSGELRVTLYCVHYSSYVCYC